MLNGNSNSQNLLKKYYPQTLGDVVGQPEAVRTLASFAKGAAEGRDGQAVFLLHGPTGVGKTAAAFAFARELGCGVDHEELGGVYEIPSGQQDGRAVEELLRSLHFRPLFGSGWRVAIINEADRMTPQAETIWLDGLEHLPNRCVVIFTTNDVGMLTDRVIRRCEVLEFSGTSDTFRRALNRRVRSIWKAETGQAVKKLPAGLGRFELGSECLSLGLALQQVTPYIRRGDPLPARFNVPIVRERANGVSVNGSAAAKKAWETRRRQSAKQE